jgi:hypothetical protein
MQPDGEDTKRHSNDMRTCQPGQILPHVFPHFLKSLFSCSLARSLVLNLYIRITSQFQIQIIRHKTRWLYNAWHGKGLVELVSCKHLLLNEEI